ncbi:hypothetical protein KY363_02700 [Candidatus Woesearchaeota archaeon]|nr:hypothetical protein [Candidatus Woesearchaeota archaeon]
MTTKDILSDAGDLLFRGNAYSKRGFTEFVLSRRPELGLEHVMSVYKPFRNIAFVSPDYQFADAVADSLRALGMAGAEKEYFERVKANDFITILPQVAETVEALTKVHGVGFYAASDSVFGGRHIEELLWKNGVAVTGAISSKDVGAMKPEPKFWEGALNRYGLRLESTAFVGHAYDEVSGAHGYGLLTVACFYDGKEDISFIPKERNIDEFGQLPKALGLVRP